MNRLIVAFGVLLLALCCFAAPDARAQAAPVCGPDPVVCTFEQAYSSLHNAQRNLDVCKSIYGNDPDLTHASLGNYVHDEVNAVVRGFIYCHFTWGGPINGAWMQKHYQGEVCPAGQEWNATAGRCDCPSGQIKGSDGSCRTCASMNGDPGFLNVGARVRPFQSMCVAGCTYAVTGPRTCTTVGGSQTCSGVFEFTGEGCTATPGPEVPEQPEDLLPHPTEICKPAGSGQTMCIKPTGEQCASTSAGKQICWKPGETGDKTSGDEIQSRRPGTDTSPPPDKPKPPETLQPPYNTVTTTTTVTNNNNTTTTVTTTTTSRRTTNGTDAGDRDDADGGDGGEGEDEGEGGAASGDCSTPPTCTLGESIGCAMLRQSWMNHCGALNGAASPDNSDFSHLNAALPGLATAVPEAWQGDEGGSDGPPTLADVDTSGWAGRGSCPIELQFSIPAFRSYTLDGTWLCHLLDALASLVTIVGMFHAGVILLSGFRKGG